MNEKRLRVAWDTQMTSYNRTGTGMYATRLLEQFSRMPEIEIETLAGWHPFDGKRSAPARMARAMFNLTWPQIGLPIRLMSLKPDLLHAPTFVAPLWGPCPSIVTIHDVFYKQFPNHYPRWWAHYMGWIVPRVLSRAAAILTVSEYSKQEIVRTYSVDPKRVHVIYHGVDHDCFRPHEATKANLVLARHGITSEYLLYVGALVERKNIPLLLSAVALLKSQNRWGDRQLVLAGPTSPGMPGLETILNVIVELGLQDDVVLTGHVADDDLPILYGRASVFVFPSLAEGFGLPLVEAMACGTPVVALAGSSVSEVVGDAGVLVSSNDPKSFASGLLEVLDDPCRSTELSDRGLRRASEFTWEETARKTLELYRQVDTQCRAGMKS